MQNSVATYRHSSGSGHVKAPVLALSSFNKIGLSFTDPLYGVPPPCWHVDKGTGYAVLVALSRFPVDQADYWVIQLTTQSLKALFEEGEHAYTGWQDVPT